MQDQAGGKTPDKSLAGAAPAALSPDMCMLRHVARTSRAVVAAYDPALTPYGFTGHQFNLMVTLDELGPLTVGALADKLGMDSSGVPRAIRPLETAGLVSTQRGDDRRQRLLQVTPRGKAAIAEALPAWHAVQSELVAAFGAERWAELANDLRSIRRMAAACSTRKPRPNRTDDVTTK